jgi:hypothetical protein
MEPLKLPHTHGDGTDIILIQKSTAFAFIILLLMAAMTISAFAAPLAPPQQGVCGDGYCYPGEEATCPADCTDWEEDGVPVDPPLVPVICGDHRCYEGETVENCRIDCENAQAAVCGDRMCDPLREDHDSCAADCPDISTICGNGRCEALVGENCLRCPQDCNSDCDRWCGNGTCNSGETVINCPADCDACGNHFCSRYEDYSECPQDCPSERCGNGNCDSGLHEDRTYCVVDCGPPYCGDGICLFPTEHYGNCPQDCGRGTTLTCGDGRCDSTGMGENGLNCPYDCWMACGNGVCDPGETGPRCEEDCPATCGDGRCNILETFKLCPVDCYPVGSTGDFNMIPWWLYGFGIGGPLLAIVGFGTYARFAGRGASGFWRMGALFLGGLGVLMTGLVAWGIVLGNWTGPGTPTTTTEPPIVVVTQEATEEPEATEPPDECGDGYCNPRTENTDLCPVDCVCVDDGVCAPGEGFNCRDCGELSGSCGTPCDSSEQCPEGLSCFNSVCWEACLCGGQCGEEGGGRNCWCEQPSEHWACCDDGTCFDDSGYHYCPPPG